MSSQYIDLPLSGSNSSGVASLNSLTGALTLVAGTGITITPAGSNITIATTGGGTGTVTSVGLSAPSFLSVSGSPVTTSGTLAVSYSGTALPILNGGTGVTSLGNLTDTGTDGITVTGGTGAVITSASISQHVADTTHSGYLSSTDWNTFNGKQAGGNYITALTGDGSASGPGSAALTLATVNANVGSFGSSTAIPSFTVNAKGLVTAASTNVVIAPAGTLTGTTLASNVVTSSLTSVGTIATGVWHGTTIAVANGGTGVTSLGNLTDAGTDGIVVTGGTGAVITSVSLAQNVADTTHNGYLSSTDWNTFNSKQASGNYITALTGDGTASGPGSAALTLATVNANVGSFGSSTAIPSFTVNAKGLVTAASTNVVIAPAGTLTGTTLASNVVTSSLTTVGTIATGVWHGTAVGAQFGGTGIDTSASTGVPSISGGTWSISTTLPAARFPALTGDVTTSAGSLATTAAATQANITSLSNSGGVSIHGQNNNTAASAGFIGEIKTINRLRSNSVALTNNVAAAIGTTTSFTLSAGNWMVTGVVGFTTSTASYTSVNVIVNTSVALPSSDTIGNASGGAYWQTYAVAATTGEVTITLPAYFVNIANGNTVSLFLIGYVQYTGTSMNGYGFLSATRIW